MKYNSPQVKPDRVTSDNGRLSSSYNSSESSYVQEGQTEDIQTNCPLGETAPDFSNHTSSYNQDGENKPKADSLIDSSQSYLGKGKITTAYKGEKSDDWFTPKWLYDSLKKEFEINYDPCPYKHGEKMGLFNDWGGESVR